MTNKHPLVGFVDFAVRNAEIYRSKLDKQIISIDGMSGYKTRHFLNNICSLPGTNYLEVGLWRGSTFYSALQNNKINAIGIDNWSEYNKGDVKDEFHSNLSNFAGKSNIVKIIDKDVFQVEMSEIQDEINVYFYDGAHKEIDQYKAFTHFDSKFSEVFIAIVDDFEEPEVQRGTHFAIKDLGYEILHEKHCSSVHEDKANYWCGQYVAVLRKTRNA